MSTQDYLVGILLVATFLMLFIAYLSYRKRQLPIAKYAALVMLAASIYTFGYAFELTSTDMGRIRFWLKVEYVGVPFISTFWLLLVLEYTGFRKRLSRWAIGLLFVIPVITLLMHYTNDLHHLYYKNLWIDTANDLTLSMSAKGPWYWIHIGYNYMEAVVGVTLFLVMYMKAVPIIRKQIMVLTVGIAFPWIFNLLYVLDFFQLQVDLTPIGFVLTGLCYVWGIYRLHLMRLAPIAMQRVFETMEDGAIFLDYDYRIIHFNPSAKSIFKELERLEEAEAAFGSVFPGESELLSRVMGQGASEGRISFKRDGSRRYYNLKISILSEGGEDQLGKLLLFHDITKEVLDQEKMAAQVNQLEELNDFKDKLFTVVAHDIRDPLAVLINLIELLEEELHEAGNDNLDIFLEVSGQVRNTYMLVENVLDWFRSKRGTVNFSPLLWELSVILESAVLAAKPRADIKDIRIRCEVADDIQVFADKGMVALILRNLLSNAIKYTPHTGDILVRAVNDEHQVIIYVKDSGIGVDPDMEGRLFQEMQQTSSPGTEGEKGTGLGLYLTKEFVRMHGGEIGYDSVRGHGATFYITLPHSEESRGANIKAEVS